MEERDLLDLFAPFGPVEVVRMFGGQGVRIEGLMFALVAGGELYLKTDAATGELFASDECSPFTFLRGRQRVETSYRRPPAACFEDPEILTRYATASLEAARRAAEARPKRTRRVKKRSGDGVA